MTTEHSSSRLMSGVRELVGAEVLVIDKDPAVQKGMTQLLSTASLHVTTIGDPAEAPGMLRKKFFSVIVVDLDTPTPAAGLGITSQLKALSPTSMIVMLTPRKSFDDTVQAIRAGAVDIVLKSPESVKYLMERVLEAAGRSVGKREVNSILADVRETYDDFLKRFMDAEKRALDSAGGPGSVGVEEIRLLVVSPDTALKESLEARAPTGFSFTEAHTGGEALDRCTSGRFDIILVVSSVRTQATESIVLQFSGPGPGGKVEMVQSRKNVTVVPSFTDPAQLIARLDELAEAFRVKVRERRYTQAFRERHYDFLRRYVELKLKIDRALGGGAQ
jgi:CheY-like chemotaxis protein